MLSSFQEYQKRTLTLIGKITVVKSLAIPNLVHAMMVLPIPGTQILNKIQKAIREFIWDGEKANISLGQLSLPYEEEAYSVLISVNSLIRCILAGFLG